MDGLKGEILEVVKEMCGSRKIQMGNSEGSREEDRLPHDMQEERERVLYKCKRMKNGVHFWTVLRRYFCNMAVII